MAALAAALGEVPLREGPTGTGLQVALEGAGPVFRWEFHRNGQSPWAVWSCEERTARVMGFQTTAHVAGHPDVGATASFASKEIDKTLRTLVHAGPACKELAIATGRNPEQLPAVSKGDCGIRPRSPT